MFNFHVSCLVPVNGIFSTNGIFIWWPKVEHINVTSYLIQFKSNETTAFRDVIGTTRPIDEFEAWDNVSGDLIPIPATTNIHTNYEDDDAGNKTISIVELTVGGNVSGILIPNKHEIVVRILVPIIDEDGELIQDMKYVEWKKVRRTHKFLFFSFSNFNAKIEICICNPIDSKLFG